MLKITALAWAVGLTIFSQLASAEVLDFDDLNVQPCSSPSCSVNMTRSDGGGTYAGFNWNGFRGYHRNTFGSSSGYSRVAQGGGVGVMYVMPREDGLVSREDGGDWNFLGGYFANAWSPAPMTIEGYNDGQRLYTQTFNLTNLAATRIDVAFIGIDQLVIKQNGGQIPFDNFEFSIGGQSGEAVPTPLTAALLLLAAPLLARLQRDG